MHQRHQPHSCAGLAWRVIASAFRRYCRRAGTFGFLSGLRRFGKSSVGFSGGVFNVGGGLNGPNASYNPMLIKCATASRKSLWNEVERNKRKATHRCQCWFLGGPRCFYSAVCFPLVRSIRVRRSTRCIRQGRGGKKMWILSAREQVCTQAKRVAWAMSPIGSAIRGIIASFKAVLGPKEAVFPLPWVQ